MALFVWRCWDVQYVYNAARVLSNLRDECMFQADADDADNAAEDSTTAVKKANETLTGVAAGRPGIRITVES